MNSRYSTQTIEDLTYPINLDTSDASRVKVLFWNLYYYTEFLPEKGRAIDIFRHIN